MFSRRESERPTSLTRCVHVFAPNLYCTARLSRGNDSLAMHGTFCIMGHDMARTCIFAFVFVHHVFEVNLSLPGIHGSSAEYTRYKK